MPPESQPGIGRLSTSLSPSLANGSAASTVSTASAPAAGETTPIAAAASAAASASDPAGIPNSAASPPASLSTSAIAIGGSTALLSSTSSLPSAAAAPPSTSSRPRFLSRLSLPLSLRNRNRNVAEFHVDCAEPHRKYTAGESVRGDVVLTVVKPLRITHLVVTLHGYVRVAKDAAAAAKTQGETMLPQGGGSGRPQYHGNGFASLFQDEQVLSGEGRLEPGKFKFGFDLEFPKRALPSSIDFERGTISYTVTATLTRPTSMAPTKFCERKVVLVETIDIGILPPPRPRTIFLEPISKRTRRKKSMVLDKASVAPSEVNDMVSEADSIAPSVIVDDAHRDSATDHRGHFPSDMRSEMSEESSRSISTAVSRADLQQLSQVGTTFTSPAQQQAVDDKTITATIELLKGGCLPGDTVSVRITVQHIKRVKSMTGVIVTLFRQGKIDSSPPAAMFAEMTEEEARRAQKEEIYPRSRTGLAGLSLSSTSSTSMFRKDLDQNTSPLIIDPATLQASVTVSLKLPDDSFPTIKGVPGEMISFKYLVEVIVDLGGKLSSQFQGSGQPSRFGSFGTGRSDQSGTYGPRGGVIVADTSELRGQRGVISVSMETVVGTIDSSRGRKQHKSETVSVVDSEDDDDVIRPENGQRGDAQYDFPPTSEPPSSAYNQQRNGQRYLSPSSQPPSGQPPSFHSPAGPSHSSYLHTNGHASEAAPSYFSPPQLPDNSNMSEKERIRQAETRLLPSQPPGAGPSSSAPDDDLYDADDTPRPIYPEYNAPPAVDVDAGPSAPTQDEVAGGSSANPVEDKQELERQRLQNEASAPPEFPDDMEQQHETAPTVDAVPDAEPTAPVIDEDQYPGYGAGAGPSGSGAGGSSSREVEQLPAYER